MEVTKQFNKRHKYAHHIPKLIELFDDGKTYMSISRSTNIPRWIVESYLHKIGRHRTVSESHRIYTINDTCFDVLTNDAVYWLGCMWGDGCISKQNDMSISGHISDLEHVNKFKSFLGSDRIVHILMHKNMYLFAFNSLPIYNKFKEYGLKVIS